MKIGDEVYIHGYVDEIRNDVVIIRNEGGYFGTAPSEVAKYVKPHIYGKQADAIIIDEPNSSENPNNCETCKHWDCINGKWECVLNECRYKPKDEPQTCSFSDCDNFKNPDYERCIECKRKQIKLKTEQTEREGE